MSALAAVVEIVAVVGIASVGALWRMAFEQGKMQRGMDAILREVQLLRGELSNDIETLADRIADHEIRLRDLERHQG